MTVSGDYDAKVVSKDRERFFHGEQVWDKPLPKPLAVRDGEFLLGNLLTEIFL
jgi:hypothetical protein